MEYLLKTRQPVKLHGVDVRIMDEEQAWHLNKLRMKQNIHIAWDLPALDLTERLKEMVRHVKALQDYLLCAGRIQFHHRAGPFPAERAQETGDYPLCHSFPGL